METREQLLEQYAEWMAKYATADKWLKRLLPRSDSAKLRVWVPTKEYLADFDKAERDMGRALDQLHQIMEKLYKLR